MERVSYTEDASLMKSAALKAIAICGAVFLVGLFIIMNFNKLGYFESALGGSLLGGGGAGLFMCLKTLNRSKRPLETIVSADANGLTFATGENQSRTVAWADIRAIVPATKGIQKGIAATIANPDAYLESLSAAEKKRAKDYRRFFGSPFSIKTNYCTESREAIADALNKVRQHYTA